MSEEEEISEDVIEPFQYGFNGMEKDNELSGDGNSYTTEFREYNPRVGRWFSIDPKDKVSPWQSPYVAFDNNPILNTDPRGDIAGGGEKRAKAAQKKVDSDARPYGHNDPKRVDCSGATGEVSKEVSDAAFKGMKYDGKFSTSLAANQAKYLQDNEYFSKDIKDAKVGDYIFWTKSSETELKNIDHTGIITKIENGIIYVANAETNTAKNVKGVWEGGTKSIKEEKLSADGTIWKPRAGTAGQKIFVGVGRPKDEVTTPPPATEAKKETTSLLDLLVPKKK
jgi:RHS repeat-associated protein